MAKQKSKTPKSVSVPPEEQANAHPTPPPPRAPRTKTAPVKPRRASPKLSGLDAALKVLTAAGKPMGCIELTTLMLGRGLWQTDGKTPAATISAAILREIRDKGKASRFRKAGRGLVAAK